MAIEKAPVRFGVVMALMCATIVPLKGQIVTTTNDFGPGSLRELIATAQAGATITFDPALSGKIIASTNGVFVLGRDVTIDGSGVPERPAIIVPDEAYASFRTNLITIGQGIHVALKNLLLTNIGGEGIVSGGDLILENVVLAVSGEGFLAPPVAIVSSGRVTIQNSELSGNAGAILNTGDAVSIVDSVFASSGRTDTYGGVIDSFRGELALVRTRFSNNYGLAISLRDGALSMSDCVFTNQPFSGSPGALDILGGKGVVSNCSFSGHSKDNGDGVVIANQSDLLLTNCTFVANGNGNQGGAIFNARGATVVVDTCSFQTNGAWWGGAINNQGNLTVAKSTFQKNAAGAAGGAIYNGASGVCSVSDSTFVVNNSEGGGGGAIYNMGTLNLLRTIVQGNINGWSDPSQMFFEGGGLYCATGAVSIAYCQFIGNIAYGGAGIFHAGGLMTISNSLLSGNIAGRDGSVIGAVGGAINSSGDLLLLDSTLSENDAKIGTTYIEGRTARNGGYGGGISCAGKTIIRNCSFLKNRGGGVYEGGGSLSIENSTFASNSAQPYFDSNRPFDYILIGQRAAGICSAAGSLAINSSTIVSNNCSSIVSDPGGKPLGAGGVASTGNFGLTNSIVSKNSTPEGAPDIFGTVNGSNNFISGEPMLAALGDYGGPTQTMLPLAGSPVIDAGGPTSLMTDQRGWARVAGAAVDIGAVEFGSIAGPPQVRIVTSGSGASVQLTFQGDKGLSYSVRGSGDISRPLSEWSLLGAATENSTSAGNYSYTEDFGPLFPSKFYMVGHP